MIVVTLSYKYLMKTTRADDKLNATMWSRRLSRETCTSSGEKSQHQIENDEAERIFCF